MATIIFDFDSTLLSCESLEMILLAKLKGRPEAMNAIHEATLEGINGSIPFSESLSKRLAIAAPSKRDVEAFGQKAKEYLTHNMEAFIHGLLLDGVDVWVISGGIYESLLPVCQLLNIDLAQVHAVRLLWDSHGLFAGIDPGDPFSRSKLEGVRSIAARWSSPVIVVGDGMSDYQLYSHKAVEHFILFTEHLACQNIIDLGVDIAHNVKELKEKVNALIEERSDQNPPSGRD